jgi:hypothetical protein
MIFWFWISLTSLTLYIWIMPLVVNELNSNGFFYYILESILQRLLSLELSVDRFLRSCSHGIRPEVILRLLGRFLKPCFLSSYWSLRKLFLFLFLFFCFLFCSWFFCLSFHYISVCVLASIMVESSHNFPDYVSNWVDVSHQPIPAIGSWWY